jgi:hypothetical protein
LTPDFFFQLLDSTFRRKISFLRFEGKPKLLAAAQFKNFLLFFFILFVPFFELLSLPVFPILSFVRGNYLKDFWGVVSLA